MTAALPASYNPTTAPSTPSLPLPPAPNALPEAWDSIKFGSVLGDLVFGPMYGHEGVVRIDIDSAVKLDKQKAGGKSKSKTKVGGKDDIKGKFMVKWTAASWEAGCRFTMQVDPQGPTGGTPLTVDNPEFMRRTGSPTLGQSATASPVKIIVKKAGALKIAGPELYSQDFDFEEWVPPDDAPGTTDTPTGAKAFNTGAPGTFGAPKPSGPPSAWSDSAVAPKAGP